METIKKNDTGIVVRLSTQSNDFGVKEETSARVSFYGATLRRMYYDVEPRQFELSVDEANTFVEAWTTLHPQPAEQSTEQTQPTTPEPQDKWQRVRSLSPDAIQAYIVVLMTDDDDFQYAGMTKEQFEKGLSELIQIGLAHRSSFSHYAYPATNEEEWNDNLEALEKQAALTPDEDADTLF